ncbi:hypothetical protein HWV62_13611 [Athelia sp. TMB]|nr:hypothetical protein HWV62_13611 [Athelia sp. TMB]
MDMQHHDVARSLVPRKDGKHHDAPGEECGNIMMRPQGLVGTPPLYYASLFGLQELVKEILSRGEDVQVRGGPCDNALQAASYHGHEGVVRILLEHGAHVNTRGGYYSNALRAAFYGGHINVARLLLEHDADVTVREECEGTLLQEAARHGDFATVQLLLEHGADANAPAGQYYGTALQNASGRGEIDIVRLLLKHGADVNAPAGPEGTALQLVASLVRSEIVRLLLERGADVNAPAGPEGTALQAAISWPDPEVRRPYSFHSPPLDLIKPYKPDCTSLEASRRGCAIVRLLLERGAEVNAPAGPKGTALQIASGRGETDIVRLLLEHGADVNAPAGPKGTALQLAARVVGSGIVRLRLERGAEVNAPTGPKGTALQIASGRGEIDIVQLLLEHGADANGPAGSEGTALQAVISWADPQRLRRRFMLTPFYLSIRWRDRDGIQADKARLLESSLRGHAIVRLLLKHGAGVNAPERSGSPLADDSFSSRYCRPDEETTVLQMASHFGEFDIVRLLLEHDADVNAPGGRYGTALLCALKMGEKDGVRLLLEHGAVIGPQEAETFIFQKRKKRNHAEILQLLLDSEAGVDWGWLYRNISKIFFCLVGA